MEIAPACISLGAKILNNLAGFSSKEYLRYYEVSQRKGVVLFHILVFYHKFSMVCHRATSFILVAATSPY